MNINEDWFNSKSREDLGKVLNKYITQIYDERKQANFEIIEISSNRIRTDVLDSNINNMKTQLNKINDNLSKMSETNKYGM